MLRANGGWSKWNMVEIIKHPCIDSVEAHAMERHYYDLLNSNMNTRIPGRTKQEYAQDNKEKISNVKKDVKKL